MLTLRRLADRLIEAFAIAVMAAMLVVVMLGVATRALNDPLVWTDELARYLMVWLALLGWMLASRRRNHIRITYFVDFLPGPARRAAEAALQAGVALFGILLASHGVPLIERNFDMEAVSMPLTTSIIYMPLLALGAVVSLQAGAQAVEALAGARPTSPDAAEPIQ